MQITERIVAEVYCAGDSIVEFVTSSPLYMTKTLISPVSGSTTKFYIVLTWTPILEQYGPQVFCAAPIDQKNLTGNQYCVNYVVGYRSPELIKPNLVQGEVDLLPHSSKTTSSLQVQHHLWARSLLIIQFSASAVRTRFVVFFSFLFNSLYSFQRCLSSKPEWNIHPNLSRFKRYTGLASGLWMVTTGLLQRHDRGIPSAQSTVGAWRNVLRLVR